jgi:CarD family transcriptional regulator
MGFRIGERVSYPNHGVCFVEDIEKKSVDGTVVKVYSLRVASNQSHILVPMDNADNIGIRKVISSPQCHAVLRFVSQDFEEVETDWKERSRDFLSKLQSGCIFEAADVLKKLTFLSRMKALSFREKRMLEKAKFLVVSELAAVCREPESLVSEKVDKNLVRAFTKHEVTNKKALAAGV